MSYLYLIMHSASQGQIVELGRICIGTVCTPTGLLHQRRTKRTVTVEIESIFYILDGPILKSHNAVFCLP